MNSYKPEILNIAQICYKKDIKFVVISPGSRSTPLTLAFLRHGGFKCFIITDERSAAFTALGIAQQTNNTVALVCTSGTAVLNYAPAVTEAFYQQIPLLLLTADRPPEWIDQFDNQSIRQENIYNNHILKSFLLPVETSNSDAKWHFNRIISEAVNLSNYPVKGPVHVNVPLREPLYPDNEEFVYDENIKTINITKTENTLTDDSWNDLIEKFNNAENILILSGINHKNKNLDLNLKKLQENSDSVLISDINANLYESSLVKYSDIILSKKADIEFLRPDLLITFGGPVLSKSTKTFIKKYKPELHWHIQESGVIGDTYQSLTDIINVSPEYFFRELNNKLSIRKEKNYQNKWLELEKVAENKLNSFMDQITDFNEFKAINKIINKLPENSLLQLGNSMPVRYANYITVKNDTVSVNSNRGTSGIDGVVSTAVGACLATGKITTLITGDLSFFYDRNGLWNNQLPKDLRVIVMNNHGGGIFRILEGSSKLPELDNYFETKNNLNAENTAKDFNLEYLKVDDYIQLDKILDEFFNTSDKAKILEIETDSKINSEIFSKFKNLIGQ